MNKNYEKLKKDLENLIDKFNKGRHEGIEIDASDIMLLNDLMEALSAIANAPSVETVTLPDGWKSLSEKQIEDIALSNKFWFGPNDDRFDWLGFSGELSLKLQELNVAPTTSLTSETNTEVGE